MTDTSTPMRHRRGFLRIDAGRAADLIDRARLGQLPDLALFDVRDRGSFERHHVDGAAHLTEAALGDVFGRIPRAAPVLIYCYHGNASQAFAGMFADFRYAEVYSVDGGFEPLVLALAQRAGARRVPGLPAGASVALAAFVDEFGFDRNNLDQAREHGLTPLMRAALLGRTDLLEALLAAGVDFTLRNGDGNNALWLACVSREPSAIQVLVAAGIDLDNRNDVGATCLMYAASSGRPEIVEALLAAGADPWIRNDDDARAVDLASTEACLRLLRHTAR